MKGRMVMPMLGAAARRLLCGRRRREAASTALIALALFAAQAPASVGARNSPAEPLSWRVAQAAPSPEPAAPSPSQQPAAAHPNAAAPAPQNDDKTKDEKTSVPATVVDEAQLESILGVEALSSTAENMGRIVDVIVDRDGQVRAAIIDFGGFLGVGSRKIAVDWRSLHFNPKKGGAVVVNLTKDQLHVAPVYKEGEPVVVIGGPGAKP
jgi:hypothetical protein